MWFIVFGLFATATVVIASYSIGYWTAKRYWREKVQAAHRYEVEAEERAHAAEEMCEAWKSRWNAIQDRSAYILRSISEPAPDDDPSLWLGVLAIRMQKERTRDRKRLGEIIWRLWGERDQMHAAILAYGNNPAGFDYGVLDAVERLEKERDALIALLSESHKANNPGVPEPNWVMMASAMQQSLDGHGGTIDEILTAIDSGTIADDAKAFIEQASVEVQEEAVRLAAADEARATKMLDLAKRAAYHFTSDTITPRTEPLSDEELDALVQDDMDAMRDWRETSDQLDGPEKGGDQ